MIAGGQQVVIDPLKHLFNMSLLTHGRYDHLPTRGSWPQLHRLFARFGEDASHRVLLYEAEMFKSIMHH